MKMKDLLRIFRALSEETRLRMLKLLLKRELCVCEIVQAMEISQTRASRNLGAMEDAGILRSWRVGPWVHYAIDKAWAEGPGREIIALLDRSANQDPEVAQDTKRLKDAIRADSRSCDTQCSNAQTQLRVASTKP